MNQFHISVLLQEAIDLLNIKPGEKYIDATFGGGGHSREILRRGGRVLALDVDEDALGRGREKFKAEIANSELTLRKSNFREIDRIAKENGFDRPAGIIFDLGVSSHQFDVPERGFSIQGDGPLDMRMDQDLTVKASDLVNSLTKGELYELFTKLGEERFARAIVNSIIIARRVKPISTTAELVEIASSAVPRRQPNFNPATRIFQALRIAVNDELNSLREALPKSVELLKKDGRVGVISFHSLEDRIVKYAFRDFAEKGLGKPVTKKPVIPSEEELRANRKSRSSKLRVFEKLI